MEKWQKTAIEKIRQTFREKGMSQHDLVKSAGFGKGHLNEVLSGKRPLTRQFVKRFADHFNLETDWFYSDETPEVVSPDILEAIERGVAQVTGKRADLTEAQRKLIDLIPTLDPSTVETLLAVVTDDAPSILKDEKQHTPRRRR